MNTAARLARNPLALAALPLLFFSFYVFKYAHANLGGNISGMLYVGTKAIQCPEAWYPGLALTESEGFDGQFTYYIAQDPLLTRGLSDCTQTDAYRYQRILLPALASLASLGKQAWIPGAIIALNVLAIALGTLLLARLCAAGGAHPALALFYPFSMGVVTSLSRCTNEILCATLVIGAFHAYWAENRPLRAAVWLALAVLAKEIALALALGIIVYEIAIKRRTAAAGWFLLPFSAFAAWQLYLHSHFGRFSFQGQAGLASRSAEYYPFQGLVDKFVSLARAIDWGDALGRAKVYVIIEPALLLTIFAAAALLLWSLKYFRESPLPLAAVPYLALLHLAQSVPPDANDLYGFGRQSMEIFLLLLLLYVIHRRRSFLVPLAANASLTLMKIYTLVKS